MHTVFRLQPSATSFNSLASTDVVRAIPLCSGMIHILQEFHCVISNHDKHLPQNNWLGNQLRFPPKKMFSVLLWFHWTLRILRHRRFRKDITKTNLAAKKIHKMNFPFNYISNFIKSILLKPVIMNLLPMYLTIISYHHFIPCCKLKSEFTEKLEVLEIQW